MAVKGARNATETARKTIDGTFLTLESAMTELESIAFALKYLITKIGYVSPPHMSDAIFSYNNDNCRNTPSAYYELRSAAKNI